MGGENCAFTNCTANRTYNKGLSYHKIPKKGLNMKNDAWREKLIQKINREDQWFTEQKKKADANIYICSRHFKPECFKTGKFLYVSFVAVEACGGYESPRRFPVAFPRISYMCEHLTLYSASATLLGRRYHGNHKLH